MIDYDDLAVDLADHIDVRIDDLADAAGLRRDTHPLRVAWMTTLVRLALAWYEAASSPRAQVKPREHLDTLDRALKHLRAFANETKSWDESGREWIWRAVARNFERESHNGHKVGGIVMLPDRVLDLPAALDTLEDVAHLGGCPLMWILRDTLVRAVERARDDTGAVVANLPKGGRPPDTVRHAAERLLFEIFHAAHLIAHDDRRASGHEFIRIALRSVSDQVPAARTIADDLSGFFETVEPPRDYDDAALLNLVRQPYVGPDMRRKGRWHQELAATGLLHRCPDILGLLGQIRVGPAAFGGCLAETPIDTRCARRSVAERAECEFAPANSSFDEHE